MQTLMEVIKARQSARVSFDPERPIPAPDMEQILEAARWAPTAHNMQNFELVVVSDQLLLEKIRQLHFPLSATFVRENYRQLSFSEEELKEKGVGVLSTMFPKSWLDPDFQPEDSRGQEHNQLLSCPALVIVLYDPQRRAPASEGDFLGIMSLGCVLENMWLAATSLGIGFHVVSSLSEPTAEDAIRELLDFPAYMRIAVSFRLGYPVHPHKYLRVRRKTERFTHFNEYGSHQQPR